MIVLLINKERKLSTRASILHLVEPTHAVAFGLCDIIE